MNDIDPILFFSESYIETKPYDFILVSNSIDRCAYAQVEEHSNLLKEDISYASNSLRSILLEDGYDTKFLTKSLAKLFTDEFDRDLCWFSLKLSSPSNGEIFVANYKDDILQYDANTRKYLAFEEFDAKDKSQCWIKSNASYVEDDVAGRIRYHVFFPDARQLPNVKISHSFVKSLIEVGDRYGYDFIAYSRYEVDDGVCVFVSYESRLQKNNIVISDLLYHLAHLSVKNKILKNGLVPKSSTPSIRHRDKVYLFNCYDMHMFMSFLKQIQHTSKTYDANTRSLKTSKDFAIFEIDRRNIHNDIKLYRDNNFESKDPSKPIALYTYSNIPPDAISFKDCISMH